VGNTIVPTLKKLQDLDTVQKQRPILPRDMCSSDQYFSLLFRNGRSACGLVSHMLNIQSKQCLLSVNLRFFLSDYRFYKAHVTKAQYELWLSCRATASAFLHLWHTMASTASRLNSRIRRESAPSMHYVGRWLNTRCGVKSKINFKLGVRSRFS
jgi:hypothetical protein